MAFLVPSSAQKTVRSVLMAQIEHLGGADGVSRGRGDAVACFGIFGCTSFATFFGGTERTVAILLNDDIFSLIFCSVAWRVAMSRDNCSCLLATCSTIRWRRARSPTAV